MKQNKKLISIQMSCNLIERLQNYCNENEVSMSQIIRNLIISYLDEYDENKRKTQIYLQNNK